jgi:thiol:disulfide interchange protein DsbD
MNYTKIFSLSFILILSLLVSTQVTSHTYLHSFTNNKQELKNPQTTQNKTGQEKIISELEQISKARQISLWYMLFLAFLAGLMVSFTPCIYPMIPITVGILQVQSSRSLIRNFFISLSYVTGIATVYSILGYLSAYTVIIFGSWMSSPLFIILLILFFIYLAFSLFGFYEIHIPSFLIHKAQSRGYGSIRESFLLGLASGTVASPCLTPALAAILTLVAKTANPLFGFLALLLFSLGMGAVLILVGTFSASLTLLPKTGEWMNDIKKVLGFVMLGTCVYFVQPFLTIHNTWMLYGAIGTLETVYFLINSKFRSTRKLFLALLGLTFTIYCLWNIL